LAAFYFANGKVIVEFGIGLLGFNDHFGSLLTVIPRKTLQKPIPELVNSFCLLIILSHTMIHVWY